MKVIFAMKFSSRTLLLLLQIRFAFVTDQHRFTTDCADIFGLKDIMGFIAINAFTYNCRCFAVRISGILSMIIRIQCTSTIEHEILSNKLRSFLRSTKLFKVFMYPTL